MKLRDLVLGEDFRTRLTSGRGTGEYVVRHRGASGRSVGGDDGQNGAGIASIDAALDQMEHAAGMDITNSCVFCSEHRTTATVYFGIPGTGSDLVASYDSVKRSLAVQILHSDQVSIEFPSLVEVAYAHSDPDAIIDLHFPDAAAAASVREVLARLGCRPRLREGDETSYETPVLELDIID